jgi:hypothetical protein
MPASLAQPLLLTLKHEGAARHTVSAKNARLATRETGTGGAEVSQPLGLGRQAQREPSAAGAPHPRPRGNSATLVPQSN